MRLWLEYPRFMFRSWRTRTAERLWMKLAWLLPKQLVYMAYIRVLAWATTHELASENVPDVRAMDALKTWERA